MNKYVDTHCHLHDPKITDIEGVVKEYENYGVIKAIDMGCCYETSLIGSQNSKKFKSVYFGAGTHPSDAIYCDSKKEEGIRKLLKEKKCVAVGEIGLDYHYGEIDKEKQKACFITQIEMAYENKLPMSIHSRDATFDTLQILKEHKNLLAYSGVIHCFSGSTETAKEYLKLGLYIGFGGTLTFKNARSVLEVAEIVPLERCLTETDSPFLSPEPYRGKLNTPKNIPIIAQKLSSVKGLDLEETSETLYKNALTLFTKMSD